MPIYTKKYIDVEAIEFTGDEVELNTFIHGKSGLENPKIKVGIYFDGSHAIPTLKMYYMVNCNGMRTFSKGDYIVKTPNGCIYPLSPKSFHTSYELKKEDIYSRPASTCKGIISDIKLGMSGYQDEMFGLTITFTYGPYEDYQISTFVYENLDGYIKELLKEAKKKSIDELIGLDAMVIIKNEALENWFFYSTDSEWRKMK